MTPVEKIPSEERYIEYSSITAQNHIVVAVINNDPCILTKDYESDNSELTFISLSKRCTVGNGYSYDSKDDSITKMIKRAKEADTSNKVEVFCYSDWNKALQWLINNAE